MAVTRSLRRKGRADRRLSILVRTAYGGEGWLSRSYGFRKVLSLSASVHPHFQKSVFDRTKITFVQWIPSLENVLDLSAEASGPWSSRTIHFIPSALPHFQKGQWLASVCTDGESYSYKWYKENRPLSFRQPVINPIACFLPSTRTG